MLPCNAYAINAVLCGLKSIWATAGTWKCAIDMGIWHFELGGSQYNVWLAPILLWELMSDENSSLEYMPTRSCEKCAICNAYCASHCHKCEEIVLLDRKSNEEPANVAEIEFRHGNGNILCVVWAFPSLKGANGWR